MNVALTVLGIILPVYAVVALGYAYARRFSPDLGVTNQLVMRLFLPALIFHAISDRGTDFAALLPLAGAALLVFLGSALMAWPLARLLGWDPRTVVPPVTFNNAGNLAIPLLVLTFGPQAMPVAVLLFLVQMCSQFLISPYLIRGALPLRDLVRIPIVTASLIGLVCNVGGVVPPDPVLTFIRMLSEVAIPLVLFILGTRLIGLSRDHWRIGLAGGVLCPLTGMVMVWLLAPVWGLAGMERQILIIFGALPPAVMSYPIAEQFNQEPQKVAAIVLIGTLLSVLTLPAAIAYALAG